MTVTYTEQDTHEESFLVKVRDQAVGVLEYHYTAETAESGWFFYPFQGFRVRFCGVDQCKSVAMLCTEAYFRGKGDL